MVKKVDLAGQKFGKLLVVSRAHYSEKGHTFYWNCLCDCGKEKAIAAHAIKRQGSCGCERAERLLATKRSKTKEKHVGKVFGSWKIVSWASANANRSHNYVSECLKCGAQEIKQYTSLKKGQVRCNSCEVEFHNPFPQDREGIPASHKLYQRWRAMVDRCYRPSSDNYDSYGAQGIRVCDAWTSPRGFLSFKSWVECNYPNWEDLLARGYQLDRKDGTKGYSPENCRLLDGDLNNKLKTYHRMVEWEGKEVPLRRLVEQYSDLAYTTVRARINLGWSVSDALFKPLTIEKSHDRKLKRVVFMGECCLLSEIVREFSLLPYDLVLSRLREGWDVETALIVPTKGRRSDYQKDLVS